MLTSEIEVLINELPQASNRRVEEIASILEGVLSDIECDFPVEDDTDSAYECQNIPKAQELIVLIRAWNVRDRESGIKIINTLSEELKTTFNQICLVSTDLG
jgi:D-alanine-D-alanine ligase-like ATP-grasp enzyme